MTEPTRARQISDVYDTAEGDGVVDRERRFRMGIVFDASRPRDGEVRAAYRRWQRAAVASRAPFARTTWYAVAGLTAVAAVAAAHHGFGALVARSSAPPAPASSSSAVTLPGPRAAVPAPSRSAAPAVESAAPSALGSAPASSVAVHAPPPAAARSPGEDAAALWRRAARALERRDHVEAERVLRDLARKHPSSADAAELARAQVLLTSRRDADARPLLERLARSGGSAVIRRRARQLLEGR